MTLSYEESLRINIIKESFHTYDKDNDGLITYEEVVSIIRGLSHNPQEKELNEIISDKSKKYDYFETFDILNKFNNKVYTLENVLEDAKLFDREATGLISSSDVIHFMSNSAIDEKIPLEELKEIIKVLDKNGKININELVKYLSS